MKYERDNQPTPNGGAYSEVYYLNDQNEVVDASEAMRGVLRECLEDGTLVQETWFFTRRAQQAGKAPGQR